MKQLWSLTQYANQLMEFHYWLAHFVFLFMCYPVDLSSLFSPLSSSFLSRSFSLSFIPLSFFLSLVSLISRLSRSTAWLLMFLFIIYINGWCGWCACVFLLSHQHQRITTTTKTLPALNNFFFVRSSFSFIFMICFKNSLRTVWQVLKSESLKRQILRTYFAICVGVLPHHMNSGMNVAIVNWECEFVCMYSLYIINIDFMSMVR